MAKAWEALHANLDRLGRRNHDIASEAWLRLRDLECHHKTRYDTEHPDGDDTIMPMLIGTRATALTECRTQDLTNQLACPGGDLSCEQ